LTILNNSNYKTIFICSDNQKYLDYFKQNLNKNITIITPNYNTNIHKDYIDLYYLSKATKVFMVSKFSSYAI
jgi:hypothetical protein